MPFVVSSIPPLERKHDPDFHLCLLSFDAAFTSYRKVWSCVERQKRDQEINVKHHVYVYYNAIWRLGGHMQIMCCISTTLK